MKKNKLLMVLALSTTCLFSIASCGAQGEKGETGDKGETGEKGDTGTPGKDGENGKDGTSFLNGEGVPSDTLGNDGDSYVDTTTFDYYTKENGKWIKKGSIKGDKGDTGDKGETGDQGEKGDTGSKGDKGDTGSTGTSGSKGETGKTAYSNTILYSEYGYITPSAGSMIADGKNEISFTVHHNDYSAARLTGLTLKNPLLNDDGEKTITIGSNEEGYKVVAATDGSHDYTFTTKMLEGGFVVSANFSEKDKKVTLVSKDGVTVSVVGDDDNSDYYFEGDKVDLKFVVPDGKVLENFKLGEDTYSLSNLTYDQNGYYLYKDAVIGKNGLEVAITTVKSGYIFNKLEYTYGYVEAVGDSFYSTESGSLTLKIVPNNGCELTLLSVNGSNKTSDVVDGKYTINEINAKINVEATFNGPAIVNYRKYGDNQLEAYQLDPTNPTAGTVLNISSKKYTEGSDDSIGLPVRIADKSNNQGAFQGEGITSANIPANITYIGTQAFQNCTQLKKVTIEDGSESLTIGDYSFKGCTSLEAIIIPDRITIIDNYVFNSCSNLGTIVLGKNIRYIGTDAFAGISSNKKFYYHGTAWELTNNNFQNADWQNSSRDNFYYFYDNEEDVPDDGGMYWHYVDGVPTVWEK